MDFCLQNGNFNYKTGNLFTQWDSPLQNGILGLQTGFSSYYKQTVREIENEVEKSKMFWYNVIWKIALMKLYVMEDVLWQKNALKLIINLYGKC